MTKNKQHLVAYPPILRAKECSDKLKSWQDALIFLEQFFSIAAEEDIDDIYRKYYACSQLFPVFYQNFFSLLDQLDEQVTNFQSSAVYTAAAKEKAT